MIQKFVIELVALKWKGSLMMRIERKCGKGGVLAKTPHSLPNHVSQQTLSLHLISFRQCLPISSNMCLSQYLLYMSCFVATQDFAQRLPLDYQLRAAEGDRSVCDPFNVSNAIIVAFTIS